jgi:hypothetical protein
MARSTWPACAGSSTRPRAWGVDGLTVMGVMAEPGALTAPNAEPR